MHGLLLVDPPADSGTIPWPAVVLGILTLVYITCIRPMRKKRERDPLAKPPGGSLLAQQRAIETDMTALLVEYEQMMRTMTSQMDMRTAKLELLFREADEKLAELKAAVAAAGSPAGAAISAAATSIPVQEPAAPITPAAVAPSAVSIAAAVASPASASSKVHADRLACDARSLIEAAAVLHDGPAAPAEPHAEIYALADRGLSFRQIAHPLDRAYGEIELILALRPRASAESGAADTGHNDAVHENVSGSDATPAVPVNRVHHRGNRTKHRRRQTT
jgi:hypothetical protein